VRSSRSGQIEHAVVMGETGGADRDSLARAGYGAVTRAADMADAVAKARSLARPGWNALLSPACASFDMFRDYEERREIFKQIVNDLR
jgi:UDP-N-acetylmuramoylalanine--D-glutamate ligase